MKDISVEEVNKINLRELCQHGFNINEFLDNAGREHYKLLAFLSLQYDDVNILDIGTHMGASATALSYNKKNKVHTFDIKDKILGNGLCKKFLENIEFHFDNLMNESVLKLQKEFILGSPLIFIDIDPHHGVEEYGFFCWLIDNSYSGIIIFDDINKFPAMKANLWDKITHEHKQDISVYGHWSGTGIVQFQKKFIFEDTK